MPWCLFRPGIPAVLAVVLVLLPGCARGPNLSAIDAALFGDGYTVADTMVVVEAPPPGVKDAGWGATEVYPAAYGAPDLRYRLDTGDRLRVFVYGQPNLSRAYTVDQDGRITVPLIGSVRARGRTTRQLERVITDRLGSEFVRDPHVTVDILQNRPFFILGEVEKDGQYPYVSGMTVLTAVAIAGGFSERANTRSFRITRRNDGVVDVIEAPADYLIEPGDTVEVHERFF